MPQFSKLSLFASAACCLGALAHADPCDPALVHDLPSLAPFSSVNAMTSWDPDRTGPLGERLVIAGDFTIANTPNVNHVAAWDGTHWSTFGPGLQSAPTVLASIFGKLIVAGPDISPVGGTSLGKMGQWNGTNWQSLPWGSVNGSVSAMKVMGDWLYIGGAFSSAGSQPSANIARWNGVSWQKLGNGLNNNVTALDVVNGEIVACGDFISSGANSVRYVARWDGQAWRPFGNGPGSPVSSMTIHNGQLVVNSGGLLKGWNGTQWDLLSVEGFWNLRFLRSVNGKLYAAGQLEVYQEDPIRSIRCWDGATWSTMQGGLMQGGSAAWVSSLGVFGGNLYATGVITHAGGAPTPGIARWTGSTWSSVGSGWSKYGVSRIFPTAAAVYAIDFADHVARWHEKQWLSVPSPSAPYATQSFWNVQGALHAISYVGGPSTMLRFENDQWTPVGMPFSESVSDLTDFQGQIIARSFASFDNYITRYTPVRWTGNTWLPIGSGFSSESFLVFRDRLYAIGKFAESPSTPGRDFARWDGTAWIPLDIGGSPNARLLHYRDQIFALSDQFLFAWNGASWSTISPPVSGSMRAATIFGGRLVAGGKNIGANGVSLAQWTGTQWQAFGPAFRYGPDLPGYIYSLAVANGTLFVGGDFDRVGSADAYNFARISACSLCPSDLNNDALVDDADFCNFILSYDLMDCTDPAMPASCPSDFNADGLVDDADFTRFVVDYAAFLCPEAD
ncbi:MAG: hypothetical protein JNM86_14170 [Phycisphaerae bacterium]|nr:hypothetical protein [Phycisphaerae bacterium]